MLIPLHDVVMIYEKVSQCINVGQISIVAFCSLDADALCTLKILLKLWKGENFQYKVYPVSTYTELQDRIEDSKCYQKIKIFLFINCGGLIDLSTKWFAKMQDATTLLFDTHKPIHHSNIASPNIKVIDDYNSQLDKAPTEKQAQFFLSINDQQIEKMQNKNDDSDEDQDDQIIAPKRKRHWNQDKNLERIDKIRKHRSLITDKMNAYYGSNFYGQPSSFIAYKMIKDLQKNNNQYLWYAIVGATGAFLDYKLTKQNFQSISDLYRSDMSKFNSHHLHQQQSAVIYEKNSIKRRLDFQFPVMRQWSLYESIMNSPYMVSKLCLWEQLGINKLNEFLNLVGLSLQEAKQLFKYMSKQSVQKLEKDVLVFAQNPKFNLFDIAYDSFAKQVDYGVDFMASDYHYALTAQIEKPPKIALNQQQMLNYRIDCFWQAYKLFESKQLALKQAIQQYKKMLTITVKQASSLIERNHVMHGRSFSFVNIHNDTPQRKIFDHPSTLIRLSYLLISMIKEKKQKDRKDKKKDIEYKPFVACLQNKETNTSMMVGVIMDMKNQFGVKFERVVDELNIDVTMNSFTPNIMTLPKQTIVKVVHKLGEA